MTEKIKDTTPVVKYIETLYSRPIRQKTIYQPKAATFKRFKGRRIIPYSPPYKNKPPEWAKQSKYTT